MISPLKYNNFFSLKMGTSHSLTLEQKQDITDIFNFIFKESLNKSSYIIKDDVIVNEINITDTITALKMKMGHFYEQ